MQTPFENIPRPQNFDLKMQQIKSKVAEHEESDHILSIAVFTKEYVYMFEEQDLNFSNQSYFFYKQLSSRRTAYVSHTIRHRRLRRRSYLFSR